MLRITVDGQPRECEPGTVLQALEALGISIPALCNDSRMAPVGACRTCIVEVEGCGRPVAACTQPVTDGMVVQTRSPTVEAQRRVLLRLLASEYPADAVARHPDKPFHRALREYGLEGELHGSHRPELRDDSHPYIHVDMSQCIHCYRCVRICDEVQGQFVWRVWNRGSNTRILPDGPSLLESSCVSCGACVDSCPSGALEDRTLLDRGWPESWTLTTCPYCGVGCEMDVGTRGGRIVTVRPSREGPSNRGHLCSKGRYAFGFGDAPDRVTVPLLREDRGWRRASWDEALGFIAERLRRLRGAHGPDALAMLGSARATNEENYLAQKLARVVLGTNNVDCCARVCHAPSAAALKLMLGTGASTNSFADVDAARTLLVAGSNTTECHPVVGARIKQAVLRGAKLIVIDSRRTELARYADVHLQPRAGTDVPLLNALAHVVVAEGLGNEDFLRERVDAVEDFRAFIRAWTPERAAELCGVDADALRGAARLYATNGPSMMVHGLGMTEHVQGTETVMALINLALLTGNLGEPGTGVNPMRGQNNVQGSAHMGCEPGNLTGYVPLEANRARFEAAWGAQLPSSPGLDLMRMMDAAREGRLKALWAFGYDVLLTNPEARATREALERLELLVVQDLFLNETARACGHVFLPASTSFEKDGTFMNGERRVQRVRRVQPPAGESLPDWEILCRAARALGHPEGFSFQSPEEVWDEVRRVWPAGAGLSYARLETGGLQWPCPDATHPGTRVLHTHQFASGQRAALRRIDFTPSPEARTDEYPFVLMTGRRLYQFNAGTMTMHTPHKVLQPGDWLDMAPADAERLGLEDGARVRVRSRYGEAVLPMRRAEGLRPGELFTTFHTPEVFINAVTGPHQDGYTHTPEYKVTVVRVERAEPRKEGA
ncbi:formate dehydrogenase subunit alpha [Myxococcus sp. RHSTA-1-4]|uniref:formate dehydrogenase subunit alpha n=1 Tax=Myxococcus sp. RHSTA-1-4 TaxID=2874601 RepID=UPI001CBB9DBB|nr:formate dehydrogenase subunit alpha [Myxococcus sp. RHSTA-1-4]MBZ4420950.1 formate dehydrogenase subunit alpha [Myxococcus sp. RHSTA-1-4]